MTRTAASSTFPATAVVLRHRDFGEKDRMLTLLSPEHGRFSAVARGARQTKSKLAAVSQTFVHARFLLARGRSFAIVTQTEIENSHSNIATDLLKSAWASYLCELCDSVPEHSPDDQLFAALIIALDHFDRAPANLPDTEIIGHWFEVHFLRLQGCSPTVGRCVGCGEKIAVPEDDVARHIHFSIERGGTVCPDCAAGDPACIWANVEALRWLHRLGKMVQPPAPGVCTLNGAARNDLRDCLRGSLAMQLDCRMKSLPFLDEVTTEAQL